MNRNITHIAILMAMLACKLFGQADSGTIVGSVTDPAGAVVPGATVTISTIATGLTRTATTNANGQYRADAFPTGPLTITVEQSGFQKLVRSGIALTAADTLTVNLALSVGNVQETVQVTSEAPLLQSQTAAVTTLITNQQMLETPINGRDFTQLVTLSSGASPSTPGALLTGLTGFNSRSNAAIAINGNTAQNNAYYIDGLYNMGLWLQNVTMVPTIDSIQEQRLMANAYSAQYGGAAGAVTLVQSKSGTSSFHGGVYEFLRNGVMDANTFFSNLGGIPKAVQKRNEYGGTFGGPIIKDKTFFFVDYQGINWLAPTTVTASIATLAQRQMVQTGDFSGLGRTIFDPTTGGGGPRSAFGGNLIPANRLNSMAQNIFSLLPAPTSSGTTNNFTYNPITNQHVNQGDARIDQNFGSDRLFVKYSTDRSDASGACTLPPNPNTAAKFNVNPACVTGGTFSDIMNNWSITSNFTKIFSPTFIDEIRVGVVRNWFVDLNPDSGRDIATALGNPSLNVQKNLNDGIPAIGISGFGTNPMIGSNSANPEFLRAAIFQYEDVATWNRGSHSIKFGGVFYRDRFDAHTSNFPRGIYDFNGQYTSQIGSINSAAGLADFALGVPDSIQRTEQFGFFGERRWRMGSFVEDAWRVNNRLTVTYGLRYEIQSPYHEIYNRLSNLTPGGQIVLPTNNPCGASTVCLDTNNWAPRVGIAYLLTKDGKTVFRAGSGFSYFWGMNGGRQMVENPPMNVQQQFTTASNAPPTLSLTQALPAPNPNVNLLDPANLTNIFIAYDTHMKLAESIQWSADIQRQLSNDLSLSVGYVGTRTNDMMNIVNPNMATPGIGAVGPRRPLFSVNPAIPDISYRTNAFGAKYHSLQVNLDKRYGKGLTGHLAYTWSHNMTSTVGPNSVQYPPMNSRCIKCEWGDVNEDRRHMLIITHVYELPFGSGRSFISRGVVSQIVGGWDLSGVWSVFTGLHNNPVDGVANISGTSYPGSVNYERPNVVAGCDPNVVPGGRTRTAWINTACYSLPPLGTFGNSGAYTLVGPGLFTVDFGLHRNFSIKEKMRLQVRWETFNTTNHTNFTLGGTTFTAVGSSSAGVISSAFSNRVMQVALKLNF